MNQAAENHIFFLNFIAFIRCGFEFEDDLNPTYTINLQFASLVVENPATMMVQTGEALTLTATIYSSNWNGYGIKWLFNGEVIPSNQGFRESSKYVQTFSTPS